jgi:hypothetical protein
MPKAGKLLAFSPVENSLIDPDGVIRPIAVALPPSVNQRLPSAPAAITFGLLPAFSATTPGTRARILASPRASVHRDGPLRPPPAPS